MVCSVECLSFSGFSAIISQLLEWKCPYHLGPLDCFLPLFINYSNVAHTSFAPALTLPFLLLFFLRVFKQLASFFILMKKYSYMRFQCTITPFTYLHSMFQCWDQFIIHKGNWETTDAPYVSLLLTSCACHTGCWFQTYFSYFCCFFGVFVKSLLLFHTFPFVFNLTLS